MEYERLNLSGGNLNLQSVELDTKGSENVKAARKEARTAAKEEWPRPSRPQLVYRENL